MQRIRISSVLLAVLIVGGCAQHHGTHLIGQLIYEGADAAVARAVPADADPSVSDCVPNSTKLDNAGRGIKVNADITPPYFVGLWPVAKQTRPENHGRIDLPSVGKPTPGDHPFLKFVVCKLDTAAGDLTKSYDWSMDEQLDGQYYVGAWFDRDMNGFPGADEPLGFYRDDPTGPATVVTFKDGKVQRFDIVITTKAATYEKQRDELLRNLEKSLQDQDEALFAAQFHPLYFKDAWGRTVNQIGELYQELVTDTNAVDTSVGWLNDEPPALTKGGGAQGIVVITQSRTADPARWLTRDIKRQVTVTIGASADGVYQFVDWQPAVEQSGDLTFSAKPSLSFSGTATLKWTLNAPQPAYVWIGAEYFTPATDAPSGGMWAPITVNTPATPVTWPVNAGDFNVELAISAKTLGVAGHSDVALGVAAKTMLRLTVFPVSGPNSYPLWPGAPATPTEPTRGNYLRFYEYGDQYIYRKLPPAQ